MLLDSDARKRVLATALVPSEGGGPSVFLLALAAVCPLEVHLALHLHHLCVLVGGTSDGASATVLTSAFLRRCPGAPRDQVNS